MNITLTLTHDEVRAIQYALCELSVSDDSQDFRPQFPSAEKKVTDALVAIRVKTLSR